MKNRILTSALNVTISIVFVCAIWYTSNDTNVRSGFNRLLPPEAVQSLEVEDLKFRDFYISGLTKGGHLYLAREQRPDKVYQLSVASLAIDTLRLQYSKTDNLFSGSFLIVDSTDIYVLDGVQPAIYRASLSGLKTEKLPKPPYFTGAVVAGNSFLLRCVVNRHNILMKYSMNGKTTSAVSAILTKQVDGMFCTDGNITPAPGGLIYSYFYRNEFIRVDSNLKVMHRGNTIDTNYRAKIEVKAFDGGKKTTMSKQPQFVNQQSAANKRYLFIRSALRADNEGEKVFENAAVIDVYHLETGKYKHSFYLPYFNNQKLTDFRVSEDRLVALFGSYVCTFKLNF